MIRNAGDLVGHVQAAVQEHGADQNTEVHVRMGSLGATYAIRGMKGQSDQRGFRLVLELDPIPIGDG